jgi:A/G-specific adenine glycosylase
MKFWYADKPTERLCGANFVKLLLEWWHKNKRDYPWRHARDPYSILIAEMLLRKTTAQQVERIYNLFLARYPTPEALAEADENQLKKLLEPLGMEYKRAGLLKKFGLTVKEVYNGIIPSDPQELLKLPGVGMYAANAVLSFVHSKDVPLLDTNFIRIVQRVFGARSEKSRARSDRKMWEFAQSLIPMGKSKDFNLAVLDFGALVCTAKRPKCVVCPINEICNHYKRVDG